MLRSLALHPTVDTWCARSPLSPAILLIGHLFTKGNPFQVVRMGLNLQRNRFPCKRAWLRDGHMQSLGNMGLLRDFYARSFQGDISRRFLNGRAWALISGSYLAKYLGNICPRNEANRDKVRWKDGVRVLTTAPRFLEPASLKAHDFPNMHQQIPSLLLFIYFVMVWVGFLLLAVESILTNSHSNWAFDLCFYKSDAHG